MKIALLLGLGATGKSRSGRTAEHGSPLDLVYNGFGGLLAVAGDGTL